MDGNPAHYVNILNIFIKYFNHGKKQKRHLFHGIETDDQTNDIMNEFMMHITEYKESDEDGRTMYRYNEIDRDDYEQLYGLIVRGELICVCGLLIPILDYIAKEIDWVQEKWKIISIQTG